MELIKTKLIYNSGLYIYIPAENTNAKGRSLSVTTNVEGTVVGTVNLATGMFGNCLSATFDNSNKIYNTSIAAVGTTDLSVGCWFKKSSPGTNDYTPTIFSLGIGHRAYLVAAKTTGYAAFYTYDGSATNVDSTVNICDGNWHHIVGTRASTIHTLYIDGEIVGSTTGTARNLNNVGYVIGGNNDAIADWIGAALIDDLFVITAAISKSDVKLLTSTPTVNYIKQYRRTRQTGSITGV